MSYTQCFEGFSSRAARKAFEGRRVLITGAGKDGGIGQAIALAAAANGARSVGVHVNASYRDGFDLVAELQRRGVRAFVVQADVTNPRDIWESRSRCIEQMDGQCPDLVICNSGLSEAGYRLGRPLPPRDGETHAERRVRARDQFIADAEESRRVLDTKVYGFLAMTHLWAGEAQARRVPLQLVYVSSMQAIEPGAAVPGYALSNWAILKLPEVLNVNLGKDAHLTKACTLLLPFVRTGLTQAYAESPKVFGRWQSRMLEPVEAARSISELLARLPGELDGGHYMLRVRGPASAIETDWKRVDLSARVDDLADHETIEHDEIQEEPVLGAAPFVAWRDSASNRVLHEDYRRG